MGVASMALGDVDVVVLHGGVMRYVVGLRLFVWRMWERRLVVLWDCLFVFWL